MIHGNRTLSDNWYLHPDPGKQMFYDKCPWCECESDDPDNCSECGKPMCGESHYECPYCGKLSLELVQCCSEMHSELCELPTKGKKHGF